MAQGSIPNSCGPSTCRDRASKFGSGFYRQRCRAASIDCGSAFYKSLKRSRSGYFVDGITDDLTTDLSQISDRFVIARNTAFTYKGKAVDAKQVGRELGVRYVLEGKRPAVG